MTEPIIRNYEKVENLHIGDNYSDKNASQQPETEYKVKYIINIEKQKQSQPDENSHTTDFAPKPHSKGNSAKPERASDTYSPEEKAEYEEYKAKIRANEPKTHKAKWW